MKILLTGATGILGSAILYKSSDFNCEVETLSLKDAWNICLNPAKINSFEFDVFVHAAANTDVDYCEQNIEQCYQDNYLLTEMLASACHACDRKFVFISSTGVYGDNSRIPYREFDETKPTTHHHRAKLLAEESVLAISSSNLVLRIGWLFGGNPKLAKNFVARRIEEARLAKNNGQQVYANKDQIGSPTFNLDVAEQIYKYLANSLGGVFNVVNAGNASRFEYVQQIITLAGIDINISPISSTLFKRAANVSLNEAATMWKSRSLLKQELRCWKSALSDYLGTYDF